MKNKITQQGLEVKLHLHDQNSLNPKNKGRYFNLKQWNKSQKLIMGTLSNDIL